MFHNPGRRFLYVWVALLAALTLAWFAADTLTPQPFSYFAFRTVFMQLSGVLAIGVALYGLVLGGTAVAAALGSRATALGGLLFLASDTLLALRLFLSGADAVVSDVAVMSTYGLGQGLLAAGVVALLRRASRRSVIQRREANPGAR